MKSLFVSTFHIEKALLSSLRIRLDLKLFSLLNTPRNLLSGLDSSSLPVQIASRAVQWSYNGTGGAIDENGIFHPTSTGRGLIIRSFAGMSDTARVTVMRSTGKVNPKEF